MTNEVVYGLVAAAIASYVFVGLLTTIILIIDYYVINECGWTSGNVRAKEDVPEWFCNCLCNIFLMILAGMFWPITWIVKSIICMRRIATKLKRKWNVLPDTRERVIIPGESEDQT